MKSRFAVSLALTLCLGVPVQGAEPAPDAPRRPRIGVAFAGGGARGGAHVGVLRILEELRIPVDYIAGTSIGSIVGALYATGMSPEEMSKVLAETDWDDALQDNAGRQDLPYRQKEDDSLYLIHAELGFYKQKLVLPGGLVAGQKLGYLLRKLTLPATSIHDFSQLPIPYRAVASDIVTGDKVVLEKGDLARSLRASMAIPGFFSPVEIDGKLLTDGGTADNLPIDVVREMGADIVIAIDISTPLSRREDLTSFLTIAGQTSGFLTRLNVLHQIGTLTSRDLLITPDLEKIGSLDFKQLPAAELRGVAAARAVADKLRQYSVSEEEYAAFLKKQRVTRTDPVIDAVRVEELKGVDPRLTSHRVRSKPGKCDWKIVEQDLASLYELGDYETVDFRFEKEDGKSVLVFAGLPRPPAPGRMRFGLKLDTDFQTSSSFGLRIGLYKTRLNTLRGELRAKLEVGRQNSILMEFYQPTDFQGRFFVSPTGSFTRASQDLYNGDTAAARILADTWSGRLDLGWSLGALGEVRAGIVRARTSAKTDIFAGTPTSAVGNLAGLEFKGIIDQLDSVTFPRKGYLFGADVLVAGDVAGGDTAYSRLISGGGYAKSFGETTLLVGISLDARLGGTSRPFYDLATAGGFLRLSGLKSNQLLGQNSGVARLIGYQRIARLNSFVGTGVYIGGSLETGNAWPDTIKLSDLRFAGSVFLAADTTLGPLYLAYGLAERGAHSLYLSLGVPLD